MTDITVIGLGDMGSALARALLKSGRSVTVWNRSTGKTTALVAEGATLASNATAAIEASPIIVTCIKSHPQTIAILSDSAHALSGKTIVELSTGGADDAEKLVKLITANGATWALGTISAYPSGVGKPETMLFMVAEEPVWNSIEPVVRTLGGASVLVGDKPGMLAAIFAGLFTARQGFMFGMIYGALVCRAAGISLQTFTPLVSQTFDMIKNYHAYFDETANNGFESDQASMQTYSAALDDVLATFRHLGASDELPALFSALAKKGIDAGAENRALTALIELMEK